jgi:hypothetical protein
LSIVKITASPPKTGFTVNYRKTTENSLHFASCLNEFVPLKSFIAFYDDTQSD